MSGFTNLMLGSFAPSPVVELPTADNLVFESTYNPATLWHQKGTAFNEDGTVMYVGRGAQPSIMVHTLGTAWDLTTASIDSNFDLGGATTGTWGLTFGDNGMKVYGGNTTNDIVSQWDLIDPYDLAGIAGVLPTNNVANTDPADISFNSTGQFMYVSEGESTNDRRVWVHELGTPWDISTVTNLTIKTLDSASSDAIQIGIQVSGDGLRLWSGSFNFQKIYTYDMSVPNDADTLTYTTGDGILGTSPGLRVYSLFVPPGRKELYIGWGISVRVQKYTWT